MLGREAAVKTKDFSESLGWTDQQTSQRLEETELRKADRTVGVNCNKFSNISSGTAWLSVLEWYLAIEQWCKADSTLKA